MTADFSLPNFVAYFSENADLPLPARQPLMISDLGALHEDERLLELDPAERVICVVNMILSILGKHLSLILPEIANGAIYPLRARVHPSLIFTLPVDAVLHTESGPLLMAPTPKLFFDLMRRSAIPRLSLSNNQEIFFPLKEGEERPQNVEECSSFFEQDVPAHYKMTLALGGDIEDCEFVTKAWSLKGPLHFDLLPEYIRFTSPAEFASFLEEQSPLSFKPWQKILIHVDELNEAFDFATYYYPSRCYNPLHWLSQMALLTGRSVNATPSDFMMQLDREESTLSFIFLKTTTLSLTSDLLWIDLAFLGSLLLKSGKSWIQTLENQPVAFFTSNHLTGELSPESLIRFWSLSSRIGYIWQWSQNPPPPKWALAHFEGEPLLIAYPEEGERLKLSLQEASLEHFVQNILLRLPPPLSAALREEKPTAFKHFLFFVFWYYLFSDFSFFPPDELPPYVKPETTALLRRLKEDAPFQEKLKEFLDNQILLRELYTLLNAEAATFGNLDLSSLAPLFQEVILEMFHLIETEIEGSPLLHQALAILQAPSNDPH